MNTMRPHLPCTTRSKGYSRRGGIYAMVIISSATVTTIALTALSLAGEQRIAADRASNSLAATVLARSAIELAMHEINTDPSWRSKRPDGWWFKDKPLGEGTIAVAAVSTKAGTLQANPCGPVLLRSVGKVGTSRTMLEVQIAPEQLWPDSGFDVASSLGAIVYWSLEGPTPNIDDDKFEDPIDSRNGDYIGALMTTVLECVSCSTARKYNGTDNYAEVKISDGSDIVQGGFAFWFFLADSSPEMGLFNRDKAGYYNGGHTILRILDNKLSLLMQSKTRDYIITGPSPEIWTWNHAAVTFGPGGLRLYLNGQLVGSDPYTGGWYDRVINLKNTEPILLGGPAREGIDLGLQPIPGLLKGSIAHVTIYNRQLAAGEVVTLYDAQRPQGPMRFIPSTWSKVVD